MECIFTKDPLWTDKWDSFMSSDPRGNHFNLTDWLKTYTEYGFDFEIGLWIEKGEIVGGYGAVIPKVSLFSFYILPCGPIVKEGFEEGLLEFLDRAKKRAEKRKCVCFQFSLPVSSNPKIERHVYDTKISEGIDRFFQRGRVLGFVYSAYGLNWIDLKSFETPEEYLKSLSGSTRRFIRRGEKSDAVAIAEKSDDRMRKGYEVIVENAERGGYAVREFRGLALSLKSLVEKGKLCFLNCVSERRIKAASFFIDAGGYYSYVSGGVVREKPDLCFGYMMQWEMIKRSIEEGRSGYNISMGGSRGVRDFKAKFGAEYIEFRNPNYHTVFRPSLYRVYELLHKVFVPFKGGISKLLSIYMRCLGRS